MNESAAPKINILGTGISNVSLPETMDLFDQWIAAGDKKSVCITPVNSVLWAEKDPSLQQIFNNADLTLCDGVPLIWASRFLGRGRLKARVTGLDLMPAFLEKCYQHSYSMFFIGSRNSVYNVLTEKYNKLGKPLNIKGAYSPPYAEKFSPEENDKMIRMINEANPDILWVSLTAPKQDFWIAEHFNHLNTRIAIGIGGALEVTAGLIPRAPFFMQRNGLEWLFRFYREPKRLFRRYILEAPAFIPRILAQKMRRRY